GNATLPYDGNTPWDDHSILSYFGRLNYDYKETYMFSAIFRADGSSNFADGHRWGYFPSFSAGWVLSNESFMEGTKDYLDFLKIRGSWGQNGNEGIGAYKYVASYSFGPYGQYSFNNDKNVGTTGGYPSRLPNTELKWETSEQLDLGFDARFLDNRLNVNFDYYQKKTKDLLIDVPVTAVLGDKSQVQNAGTIKNSGVELALSWNDKLGTDFNYNVGWNIATNKNEVTEVNNGSGYINGAEGLLSQGTTFMARMEEGEPLGYFYGYKTAGVIQNTTDLQNYLDANCGGDASHSLQGSDIKTGIKPGDLKFVDTNGDGFINDKDKTNIGNPHPTVTMGLNLGFDYKGLDFSISGYGAFGMQVAHSYRRFGDSQYDNWSTNVYNYWNGEGTGNGRYPILTAGTNTNMIQVSDLYVDDADYFRIQSLTVGYDFKKIWKSCPFQKLRLYFQAQNLFTITGYDGMDPEQGSSIAKESWVTGVDISNYPSPRTFLFGVNVKF
ncbi:MAG: SusC/RagA family TonB-linked outer membrane protein, partial [Bacteroidaceae bacterium]|nr:SusC/RagA family TonB-linked outer membrane protein [Bacteroidaceae bacterium]